MSTFNGAAVIVAMLVGMWGGFALCWLLFVVERTRETVTQTKSALPQAEKDLPVVLTQNEGQRALPVVQREAPREH